MIISSIHHYNQPTPITLTNNDTQQQLRYFLSLVQQYNKNYNTTIQLHNDVITQQITFQTFIQQMSTHSQSSLQKLFTDFKQLLIILQKLLTTSLTLFPQIISNLQQNKYKYLHLQQQLTLKSSTIQQLNDQLLDLKKNLNQILIQNQKSRLQYLQLNQRLIKKQLQFELQSKDLKKSLQQHQQSNQNQKLLLLQLHQKHQLQKKLLLQLNQNNSQLVNHITTTNLQKSQIQLNLTKSSKQLLKKQQQIIQLQTKLQSQQIQLRNCQIKLKLKNNNQFSQQKNIQQDLPFQQTNQQQYQKQPILTQSLSDKQDDKAKLNQQLKSYKAPSVMSLSGSFFMRRGSANSFIVYQNQQGKQRRLERALNTRQQISDPYYSHYILISQSVKIKQDCDDMLSVDMKPYYREIIQKRVPMHLWDQWVKNRLRQLLRKDQNGDTNKPNNNKISY